MLDTVQIKHFFRSLACDDFQRNWTYLSRAKNQIWILNAKEREILPNLTMLFTPNGLWHLSAEVSIPKLLFGHNARLPNQDEVYEGLQVMCDYAESQTGLKFDAQTAIVSRVDFAKDFRLSETQVYKVLRKLSEKNLPRLEKLLYNNQTLYFLSKAKTRQIRIYPKFQEVLSRKFATDETIETARGVLRFEHCLLKKYALDHYVKKLSLPDSSTQSLLNENVSNYVISEVLEDLNFFELLTTDKTNLEILREHFSTRKAMNLCGFLEMVSLYGEDFYKDEALKFSRDSYFSDARFCRKAKVWKSRKPLE